MEARITYEWDEAKRRSNVATHQLDFDEVNSFEWDRALTFEQQHAGEARYLSYAPIADRLYALVWTWRGTNIRIISFRKANSREVTRYENATNS